MRSIKILGMAFAAVLALTVVVAGSASAHEWLVGGKPVTTALAGKSKTLGKGFLLEDAGAKTAIICPGTDEGTVGPGAADFNFQNHGRHV